MTRETSDGTAEQKLSCRDWIVMATLPCIVAVSTYDNFGTGSLLPLLQEDFQLADSDAGILKSTGALAHGIAFASMWLLGDFAPKKALFLISVASWIGLSLAAVMCNSNQFWLYVLLKALSSMSFEGVRILVTVLQADHFTGKYIAAALTINMIGESIAVLLASTVNSIFVANKGQWRFAMAIGPILSIPLLFISAIFLRKSHRVSVPNHMFILRNAAGILKIPSYVVLAISQCLAMFYSITLGFWLPSLMLYAFETHPDVFLGLSFPVMSSTISIGIFVAMLIGSFLVPYLSQTLQSGLCCIPPTALAIPLVYAVCSLLETLVYVVQVTTITRSFPIYVTAFFVDGLAGSGITLNNIRIILTTVPAHQRASALSLLRLMIAAGNVPSAQIIGAISDYFRGDSTETIDRLEALQTAFLYTWIMPVASTVLCFVLLRFYKKDVERAKFIDLQDQEESTALIKTNEGIH